MVAFHLYLLRCGLRWLEGQVRMFGEGGVCSAAGEHGQVKPWGEA